MDSVTLPSTWMLGLRVAMVLAEVLCLSLFLSDQTFFCRMTGHFSNNLAVNYHLV